MGDLTGVMSTVFKRIPIGGSAAVFKVGVLPSRRKNNQVGDQVGKKPGFFWAQKVVRVFDVWGFWNITSLSLLLMMIGLEKYGNSSGVLKREIRSRLHKPGMIRIRSKPRQQINWNSS